MGVARGAVELGPALIRAGSNPSNDGVSPMSIAALFQIEWGGELACGAAKQSKLEVRGAVWRGTALAKWAQGSRPLLREGPSGISEIAANLRARPQRSERRRRNGHRDRAIRSGRCR